MDDWPKTDSELLRLIREAAKRTMTPEERFEQSVSFVYGQISWDDPRTKDEIRESLRAHLAHPSASP